MKDRIQQIIEEAGITQLDFAEKLRVNQSTVSLWLSGKRRPSDHAILLISEIFRVSRHWLETGEGTMVAETPISDAERMEEIMHGESENKRRLMRILADMPDELLDKFMEYLENGLKEPEA